MFEVPMVKALPDSVRYVKNGGGGQWWRAAKANGRVHLGWRTISDTLLRTADMEPIERLIRAQFGDRPGATQDFKALRTLLLDPSQHVWVLPPFRPSFVVKHAAKQIRRLLL